MQDRKLDNPFKTTNEDSKESDPFQIKEVPQTEEQDPNLTEGELDEISGGVIRVSPRMNCGAGTCCVDMKKGGRKINL